MTSSLLADRYRLEDVLSATVMAEVRTATDVVLERRVVVKLLAPEADRSRFEREAQAAAALSHPNIVQLFDYGEAAGRPYIVFEHLSGGSLEDRLTAAGPLPDGETTRVASDIAAGLAHAHERGVVHRDLKPGNVLFDAEGRGKIADFGIAQLTGAVTLTDAGTVLGTAAYISPEQTYGDPATPASDVYSFGVVLYRMLTGRLPFESESPVELAAMHRDAEPPDLREIRPDAPPALAAVAMAALAKDPDARPADGHALSRTLASQQDPATAQTAVTNVLGPPAPQIGSPPRRRGPSRAAVAILALLLLAAGGAVAAVVLTNGDSPAPAVPLTTSGKTTTARTTTAPTSPSSTETKTSSPTTTQERPTTSTPRPTTSTAPTTTRSTTAPTTTAATTTAETTTAETTTAETTTAETTTTP